MVSTYVRTDTYTQTQSDVPRRDVPLLVMVVIAHRGRSRVCDHTALFHKKEKRGKEKRIRKNSRTCETKEGHLFQL